MTLDQELVNAIVNKYVHTGNVIAVGTSEHALKFLKKLAFKVEEEELSISLVPTSGKIAILASSLGLKLESINEREIDVGIEFVDQVDQEYNFVKRDTHSLVRDKMIAQSAGEFMVILEDGQWVKKLQGRVPFEITPFGWKRTLIQLDAFGKAKMVMDGEKLFKTDSGNYLVHVDIDPVHDVLELDAEAKSIPGVIETGIFPGYADRVLMHNGKITVKSRIRK